MKSILNFDKLQSLIQSSCSKIDSAWIKRKRKITTLHLLHALCTLVCKTNNMGYVRCLLDLDIDISPGAFSKAREKFKWQYVREIFFNLLTVFDSSLSHKDLWLGHRIFGVDGSGLRMPINFKNIKYLKSGKSYYPSALISVLHHLKVEVPYDMILARHRNERVCASGHLNRLKKDDVIVYDRGYFSFSLFLKHHLKEVHAVFRLSISAFSGVKRFIIGKEKDKIIEKEINGQLIKIRLVKYSINGKVYVLATTLLDPRYTIAHLKDLYHARWGVEELYKKVKRVYNIEDFHGKTPNKVRQELWAMSTTS